MILRFMVFQITLQLIFSSPGRSELMKTFSYHVVVFLIKERLVLNLSTLYFSNTGIEKICKSRNKGITVRYDGFSNVYLFQVIHKCLYKFQVV